MVRSFNQHLVLIFVLLIIGLEKTFSLARRQVIISEKEYAAVGDTNISLHHQFTNDEKLQESVDAIVTSAAKIDTYAKTRGRKMTMETRKTRKDNKVSSSAAVENYNMGERKLADDIGEEKNWKDDFMAFSADYRSAKSHPPKNN